MKNEYIEGNCLKRGVRTVRKFKGGGAWRKRGGVVFVFKGWGVNPNAHYALLHNRSSSGVVCGVVFRPKTFQLEDVFCI